MLVICALANTELPAHRHSLYFLVCQDTVDVTLAIEAGVFKIFLYGTGVTVLKNHVGCPIH